MPWFPFAYGHPWWSCRSQGSSCKRSQASDCLSAAQIPYQLGTMVQGTIKSRQDIERLFQTGRRSSSSFLTIITAPSPSSSEAGRCAFIAGKKLGVAPLRNRCKRVMRAAAAECGAPWEGFDVVFVARRKAAYGNTDALRRSLRKQLNDLGVLET